MSRTLRNSSIYCVVLSCVLAFCLLPSWAKDKEAPDYPLSGKVLSSSAKGLHSYQIETDSRIYLLMCERVKGFHMGLPDCLVGDKPIATGDTVQFRVDGDRAFMPVAKGEDELRILTTEFKVIPPLPPAAAGESGKGSNPGNERGMVIGTGLHIMGQKQAWSTNPSSVNQGVFRAGAPAPGIAMATPSAPVMATGPVMAIPVTGGAPVMVIPSGPVGGGIVTGVPVTGGAPITGIATGPVMGMPMAGAAHAGGPAMGGGGPAWVHILRVQSGKNIYQLECSAKPCEVDKKQIELGDALVIRAEKKWAYVSFGTDSGVKEQKLRILSETEDEATPDAKTTDAKTPDAKTPDAKTPDAK
jgi:hypothetical protein